MVHVKYKIEFNSEFAVVISVCDIVNVLTLPSTVGNLGWLRLFILSLTTLNYDSIDMILKTLS